jgi:hypothetical protein
MENGVFPRPRAGPAATRADVLAVVAELQRLRAEVAEMRQTDPGNGRTPAPSPPPEQLVTLSQAAAMARRSKRTLEGYRGKGLPPPRFRGRPGAPSLWAWHEIRPWLEATFGLRLPEEFPGGPF